MGMDPNDAQWYTVLFPNGGDEEAPPGCRNAFGNGCIVALAFGVLIVLVVIASALSH